MYHRCRGYDPLLNILTSDLWDPFELGIDRDLLIDDDTSALARIDWRETEHAHIFRADLPGMRKEDMKVEVHDNNVLQISGKREKEEKDKNDMWHRIERSLGSFLRRFRLPENAKTDETKSELQNGEF